MEHNRDCIGEVYGYSKFAHFQFNVEIFDKRKAVRIFIAKESPYVIKKNTEIAEVSVVAPGQSKHIRAVDMVILSMIPQGDSDLTAYTDELLRNKKSQQQKNTFWFPTPENPRKSEGHTPIQTRILKKLFELKQKEKINPQEGTESGNKNFKRFDWTDTLPTETEKQATEDSVFDYHDVFSRHRMDIGMNTEFKVTNSERQWSCIQPKSINANPLERRPTCWITSDTQRWNHHGTASLQERKSHFCTE